MNPEQAEPDTRTPAEISRAKEREERKAGFRSPRSPAGVAAKKLQGEKRQAAARAKERARRKASRRSRK